MTALAPATPNPIAAPYRHTAMGGRRPQLYVPDPRSCHIRRALRAAGVDARDVIERITTGPRTVYIDVVGTRRGDTQHAVADRKTRVRQALAAAWPVETIRDVAGTSTLLIDRGRAASGAEHRELMRAIERDDADEESGAITGDQRATCHRCQDWAHYHAHDRITGARLTVAEYRNRYGADETAKTAATTTEES